MCLETGHNDNSLAGLLSYQTVLPKLAKPDLISPVNSYFLFSFASAVPCKTNRQANKKPKQKSLRELPGLAVF